MANYVKATNFTAKDSLPSGNAGKIIKGAEIDTEFTAIASAISSKADINSPALTGTPTAPTAAATTNTTQVATTAFVRTEITNLGTIGTMAAQNANAVAITGGSIAGITDLAVADGGTGVSTIAANAVVLGNGTSAIQTVAPGSSGNVLTSNGTTWTSAAPASVKGLGFGGETWQDVLGSRSSGTTYTAPNYPIMVAVSQAATFQSHTIVIVVNGVTISNSGGGGNFYNGGQETSFIVPANATYSVTVTTAGFNTWAELR